MGARGSGGSPTHTAFGVRPNRPLNDGAGGGPQDGPLSLEHRSHWCYLVEDDVERERDLSEQLDAVAHEQERTAPDLVERVRDLTLEDAADLSRREDLLKTPRARRGEAGGGASRGGAGAR